MSPRLKWQRNTDALRPLLPLSTWLGRGVGRPGGGGIGGRMPWGAPCSPPAGGCSING